MDRKVRSSISFLFNKSLNSDQIRKLSQEYDQSFDLYRTSGFGDQIRIPVSVAVDCILDYFNSDKKILGFLSFVFQKEREGVIRGGRMVQLLNKPHLLKELEKVGWKYDGQNGAFIKDQTNFSTSDWGFLEEGREYPMSFAHIDVVGSSVLVDNEEVDDIESTMRSFQKFSRHFAELWEGRIWKWAGDGGLLVFQGGDSPINSVLSVASLLFNLPVFNIEHSRLKNSEIKIRAGIHRGPIVFQKDVERIYSPEMKIAERLEHEYSAVNGIAISAEVFTFIRGGVREYFQHDPGGNGVEVYKFKLA